MGRHTLGLAATRVGRGQPPVSFAGFPDEPWVDAAICPTVDPEIFFPEYGETGAAAKKVCLVCPVRAECLAYAVKHTELRGIWGGRSDRERAKLRRGEPLNPLRSPHSARKPASAPVTLLTCVSCGSVYAGAPQSICCSDLCRADRRRDRQRAARSGRVDRRYAVVCRGCATSFEADHHNVRYCSDACRRA